MIELVHIHKQYGDRVVIDALNLRVQDGEHLAITAPSGCGKTTLLHIIAGLTRADGGSVTGFAPSDICMLFQEVRLFERFSALENVMAVQKGNRRERMAKAIFWLSQVELTREDMDKLPHQLSGGQGQRVALARALAAECPIVLLDEPFKGLDGETKAQIYALCRRFLAGKTLLLVTHDEADAHALDCRVLRFTTGMKQVE